MSGSKGKTVTRTEQVSMRDGVRIAVDLVLPATAAVTESTPERVPCVLIATRYWRSYLAKGQRPGPITGTPICTHNPPPEDLVRAGYAVVLADVRGTGASEGVWAHPFSADETKDMGELVEWIAKQLWSNGRVGTSGISYEGSTAVLAVASQHPALQAVSARSFEYVLYDDIAAPGGVMNHGFFALWQSSCKDLDSNKPPGLFPWYARFMLAGVRPLDSDQDGSQVRALIAARNNPSVYEGIAAVRKPTDSYGDQDVTLEQLSVRHHLSACKAPITTPIQLWGSWMDGTTSRSVLAMWQALPEAVTQVWIGAWSHEGTSGASLGRKSKPVPGMKEQNKQALAFFDARLKSDADAAAAAQAPRVIHYFTMGEDKWHETPQWPPVGTERRVWHLGPAHDLIPGSDADAPSAGDIVYEVDPSASTGKRNRWFTQMALPVKYEQRGKAARHICVWTSAKASSAFTITGEPTIELDMTLGAEDPPIIVYLELIDARGNVVYVTEGIARPSHATGDANYTPSAPGARVQVRIALLPTSVLVPAQWALRLGVCAGDKETFPVPSAVVGTSFTFHSGAISLPVTASSSS